MKRNFIQCAERIKDEIIENRRHIHKNPELGLDLPETCSFVRSRLESMGYKVEDCGQSGLTATVGKGGKTILLRGDMDALPTKEETDLEFKSQNDNGHLCGHDMHTAMLLGAAKILKENEEQLKGTVKFMFQPGEETAQGAKSMIEAGLLENPKVDAAIALHVISTKEKGKVYYIKGPAASSIDAFFVEVTGKGGHGSMPEDTIDPLHTVVNMYSLINGIVGRESNMFDPAVLTVGVLGGGQVANVIPQTAVLEGTFRCYSEKTRERISNRLKECVEAACKATGADYTFKQISTPALYNNPELCQQMIPYLQEINGEENVLEDEKPMSGSEDFSYVSQKVPSLFIWMGAGHEGDLPLHNPAVMFDEDVMPMGAATLAYCAAKWLEHE